MKYELRKPTPEDIAYLSYNLRASDIRELYALYGHVDALGALTASIDNSDECYVGVGENGLPALVFGLLKRGRNEALIWALATPELINYRIAFIRRSKECISRWFSENPDINTMFNFSHSANTLHHQWLEWCGAHMLPTVPWGTLKEDFTPFVIRRETYVNQ